MIKLLCTSFGARKLKNVNENTAGLIEISMILSKINFCIDFQCLAYNGYSIDNVQ